MSARFRCIMLISKRYRQRVFHLPSSEEDNAFRISEFENEDDCLLLNGAALRRLDLRVSENLQSVLREKLMDPR